MAFFSYLDENSDITNLTFNDRPRLGPLDKASQQIMRGKSAFSIAEREMMAAFVSGLNACSFCHGVHAEVASRFDVNPEILDGLIADIDSSTLDSRLKPVFHYLRKLTLFPSKIVKSDVQKVLEAGWSEEALHEAILVGCLFNFYNRLLDGHGIKGNQALFKITGDHLSKRGYGVPWFIGMIKNLIWKKKLATLEKMQ